MTAKFIGTNGSLGLKTDTVYPVEISTSENGKYIWVRIFNAATNEIKVCPYSSLAKLNENWE